MTRVLLFAAFLGLALSSVPGIPATALADPLPAKEEKPKPLPEELVKK